MTPVEAVQGVVPVSKPGLPSFWPAPGHPPVPSTVSVYDALWTAEPVPVTVMVYEPGEAAVVVATVMVDDPPDVTDAGLKLTETPAGAPELVSVTVCALPEVVAVLTVEVAEDPGLTVPAVGLSASEKSLAVDVPVVSVQRAYSSALAHRPREVVLMFDGYESHALW